MLRGVGRNLMVFALVCETLFVVLDLAVTWTTHAALFVMSSRYNAATETQRAALVAAAGFPSAVMDAPVLSGIYAIVLPALGPFFAGLVMLKGAFGRGVAVLGLAVGATGIVAVAGPIATHVLDLAPVVNALLVTVWYGWVGVRLLRLGRS